MNEREGIVGSGDIASILESRPDMTFFASGVSNSQEVRESEYEREKELLLAQDRDQKLVYFGSLSIFYNDNRYAQHKREMEEMIIDNFPRYCIIRIGNITWGNNPHTLINTLKNRMANQDPIEIRDVYRYVVDEEEFLHWISIIPDFNCEINVPGERLKVKEIFDKYV